MGGPIDDVGIRWIISGTRGEIPIAGPEWWQTLDKEPQLQVKAGNQPAQMMNFDSYRVPAAKKVAPFAANVTFESADKTHRLPERIRKSAVAQ